MVEAGATARSAETCARVGTIPDGPAKCGRRWLAYALVAWRTYAHRMAPRGVCTLHRGDAPCSKGSEGRGEIEVTGVLVCRESVMAEVAAAA